MADTIAAIATGGNISAVGILRLSGERAISAADSIFRAKSGKKMIDACNRALVYGELCDGTGRVIDLCLCTVSRAPSSYTGEDTVEFHCHGSPVVLSEALQTLFKFGVRQAEAGEFTKRAFLNGQLDLSQAEAVIDLIEAETTAAALNAAGQLGGAVSRKINDVYNALTDISAHFFAVIDYPDEDIEAFELQRYAGVLQDAESALNALLASFERGKILKDGVPTAIIGRPNVGKSSLLNTLIGYERAIVTDIAGTTRDTIEEKLLVGGVLLRLTDTAGIRETEDTVERLGVERSRRASEASRLVIAVFDGHTVLNDDDRDVIAVARAVPDAIALVNKADLPVILEVDALKEAFCDVLFVSAKTGEGLNGLADTIKNLFAGGTDVPAGELLTNARQADAITRAADSLRSAHIAMRTGITPDAVLTEIEAAMSAVGEITGKTVREDITFRIFERFCVGK